MTEGVGVATVVNGRHAGPTHWIAGVAVLVGVLVVQVDVLVLVGGLVLLAVFQGQVGLQMANSDSHLDKSAPGTSRHCLWLLMHRAKQRFSASG